MFELQYFILGIVQGFTEFLPISSSGHLVLVSELTDWQDQGLGIIFDLPTALFEYLFKIEDSENYYLFRHITNYLFFLTSLFFFFMIIVKRYQS